MHPDELEEMQYQFFPQTELQNAFAVSRMEREPDDSYQINEALANGKFVVVTEGTEYCPRTDAIMGSRRCLNSIHDTREQAEAEVAAWQAMDPEAQCEFDCYILPRVYLESDFNVSSETEVSGEVPF